MTTQTQGEKVMWQIRIEDGDFSSTPSGARSHLVVHPGRREVYVHRVIGVGADGAVYSGRAIQLDVPPDTEEAPVRAYLLGAGAVLDKLAEAFERGDREAVGEHTEALEDGIDECPQRWSAAEWIREAEKEVLCDLLALGSADDIATAIDRCADQQVSEALEQAILLDREELGGAIRQLLREADKSDLDDDDRERLRDAQCRLRSEEEAEYESLSQLAGNCALSEEQADRFFELADIYGPGEGADADPTPAHTFFSTVPAEQIVEEATAGDLQEYAESQVREGRRCGHDVSVCDVLEFLAEHGVGRPGKVASRRPAR